jgi:hypothetical protein
MKHFVYFLKNISLLLCLFCGGVPAFSQSLVAIPNPAGHTVSSSSPSEYGDTAFLFQNKLVVRLQQQEGMRVYKLALFDGQNYTIVENPDNGQGYSGHPIIFRNELYVQYKSSTGVPQLAKLVANRLVIIPNVTGYTYTGFPLVYKNRMYLNYNSGTSTYLAYFDGNSINVSVDQIDDYHLTTIYKNKLYFISNKKIIVLDSLTQSVFWENPNAMFRGGLTVHNDTLFWFMGWFANNKILKTDGTTLQEVSAPNNLSSPLPYHRISLNNKLYIFYSAGLPGQTTLIEYNNSNTRIINNPDNGMGIDVNFSKPVIYRDTLFFHYLDNQGNYQLAKLNGNSIVFVGASMNPMTYSTYPTVFRGNLYYGAVLAGLKLLRYNGQRITVTNAPDSLGVIPGRPIIFNNALYVKTFNHLAVLEEEGGGSVSTQNIENDNIKIYPNPTNQLLNVVLEEEGQIGKIEIFNLLGQKVLSQNLTHQINQIPVENLSTGTYLANILIGEKVFHKTFIKQ